MGQLSATTISDHAETGVDCSLSGVIDVSLTSGSAPRAFDSHVAPPIPSDASSTGMRRGGGTTTCAALSSGK